jgi:hypothetical protein
LPAGSNDAAVLITLNLDATTAQVESARNASSGAALIEIYKVPQLTISPFQTALLQPRVHGRSRVGRGELREQPPGEQRRLFRPSAQGAI